MLFQTKTCVKMKTVAAIKNVLVKKERVTVLAVWDSSKILMMRKNALVCKAQSLLNGQCFNFIDVLNRNGCFIRIKCYK